MPRKTPENSPQTEWASDRLRLLGPLITPRVVELARMRLTGTKLVKGKDITVPDGDFAVKLALILTHFMNPAEKFSVEEEGVIRGMDCDGINKAKKEGLIRAL